MAVFGFGFDGGGDCGDGDWYVERFRLFSTARTAALFGFGRRSAFGEEEGQHSIVSVPCLRLFRLPVVWLLTDALGSISARTDRSFVAVSLHHLLSSFGSRIFRGFVWVALSLVVFWGHCRSSHSALSFVLGVHSRTRIWSSVCGLDLFRRGSRHGDTISTWRRGFEGAISALSSAIEFDRGRLASRSGLVRDTFSASFAPTRLRRQASNYSHIRSVLGAFKG